MRPLCPPTYWSSSSRCDIVGWLYLVGAGVVGWGGVGRPSSCECLVGVGGVGLSSSGRRCPGQEACVLLHLPVSVGISCLDSSVSIPATTGHRTRHFGLVTEHVDSLALSFVRPCAHACRPPPARRTSSAP